MYDMKNKTLVFFVLLLINILGIISVPAVQFGCPIPEDDPDFCALVDVALLCESDDDCKHEHKCCTTKCGGTACLDPMPKHGNCPRVMPVLCAAPDPNNPPALACGVDKECPGTEKCCQVGCGATACKKIVPSFQFGCPLPDKESTVCNLFPRCDEDSDCKEGEKCCRRCGEPECVKSVTKPGMCGPVPAILCIRMGDTTCGADSECDGFKKCCVGGCGGTVCSPPAAPPVIKFGCPFFKPNFPQFQCTDDEKKSKCKDDENCPKGQTCCPNGCSGSECLRVKQKKGSCPLLNPLIRCPFPAIFDCGSDKDCPGKQKCCQTQCSGIRCVDPFKCKDKRKFKTTIGDCKKCSCKKLKKMNLLQKACAFNFDVRVNCCKSCKKLTG